MSKGIEQLAYEHMLLARHSSALGRTRREGGLERSAYILLSRLEGQGPMTVNELSDAFLLDTSTIHRQVTVLLKEGLLERFPDPGGRMVRKLRMTEDGQKALERHRSVACQTLDDLLTDWPEEDVMTFVDYLCARRRRASSRWSR